MTNRMLLTLVMALFVSAGFVEQAGGAEATSVTGRRLLSDHEPDVYGPLPFSEEVTGFLAHELNYILQRQNRDGSWDSAEPTGKGRTRLQAGGTVGNVTLTSMCGHSLRHFAGFAPEKYRDAIERGISVNNVYVTKHRMLERMREAVEQLEGER